MTGADSESILVVNHLPEERAFLTGALRRARLGVRVASNAEEAIEACDREPAAVVVTERELPGRDGFFLTGVLCARHPETAVIVVCERPEVRDTVDLMREGAFHVLTKPVKAEELAVVAQKALEHVRLTRGNRDLKTRLDVSEKLAMIGRLASGVAHELNNPLDGVRRYVRLTQEGLETEAGELNDYLDRAMSGLTRMAGIVRQLLTFSRNVVVENEQENLATLLDEVVRTLAPTGSAAPVVELEAGGADLTVPRVLFQVFVNLVRNALDAVDPLGPRGRVRLEVRPAGDQVAIQVSDNGSGIDPQDLPRVFEPFFTTKEVGKGTGLGLPISARIVERCGGALDIRSEKGAGTTVRVTLPLSTAGGAALPRLQKVER